VGEAVFVEAALPRLPELPTDIQQGLRSRLSGLMAHRATKLEARDLGDLANLGDLGDGSARVRQGKGKFLMKGVAVWTMFVFPCPEE